MSESFQEFCKRIMPVVQAGAEGKKIELLGDDGESWTKKDTLGFINCCEYRIAEPKTTPLPITPEMWAMIDPRYRWVVLSPNGEKYACESEPKWVIHDDSNESCWMYGADKLSKLPLVINTFGIIPELSLTKRPDRYDATLDAWTYYKPAIDRAEGDGKGGVINKQFARAVPDVDEVIASIKKTAEEGRKHGVRIVAEEFSKERIIRDVAAETSGTDYIVTEHYNPITGITQTIRTKIK